MNRIKIKLYIPSLDQHVVEMIEWVCCWIVLLTMMTKKKEYNNKYHHPLLRFVFVSLLMIREGLLNGLDFEGRFRYRYVNSSPNWVLFVDGAVRYGPF